MDKRLRKVEQIFLLASLAGPTLFILLLTVVPWPRWWKWTVPELTPLGWMQSVLLFSTSLFAFLAAVGAYFHDRAKETRNWFLLGIAFFYFCLDERFAFHERIRDRILAPMGFKIPGLFWVAPGDYVMLAFMGIGLFMLPRFLSLFQIGKEEAKRFFYAAVAVSAVAILADSFDYKLFTLETQRLEQFWEEMLKTIAMIFFLNAYFQRALNWIFEGKDEG